jgi:hypothetical protein
LREARRFCSKLLAVAVAQYPDRALKTVQVQPLQGLLAAVTAAPLLTPQQQHAAVVAGLEATPETAVTVATQPRAAITALAVVGVGVGVGVTATAPVPAAVLVRLASVRTASVEMEVLLTAFPPPGGVTETADWMRTLFPVAMKLLILTGAVEAGLTTLLKRVLAVMVLSELFGPEPLALFLLQMFG